MEKRIKQGHRIAVISDTHNLLRPEVVEAIKSCDVVLHGGDLKGPKILEKIRELCGESASSRVGGAGNLYVVRGNNDREWAEEIPYTLEIRLYGLKFFMTHKKKSIPSDVDADVVIYGHSHRYEQEERNGTLYLNPGSCGPRRFNQPITMAVLTIADAEEDVTGQKFNRITVEKIEIPHDSVMPAGSSVIQNKEQVSGDMIRKICADIKKRRSVSEIAAIRNLSPELTEQIVRLYLTHPGVTPEQIMSKMGL